MADAKAKARDAPVDGDTLSEQPDSKRTKTAVVGPMDAFVQSQKQINDDTCNFVLDNAPNTQPEGYKKKLSEAAELNEQLDAAYDDNDFDTVEKVQPKYEGAMRKQRPTGLMPSVTISSPQKTPSMNSRPITLPPGKSSLNMASLSSSRPLLISSP